MRADKKISWGMTLLTAMLLQACGGGGGGGGGSTVATPPPVVQGAVQVAPNAAAITLADQQQIQSVEEAPIDPLADDGSRVKMTFAHPSAALAAVPVGQVLVFDQDAHFPEGYAGKVTARTVNPDGSVSVSFKDAQLTEVFKNLKIEATPENSALKNPRVYPADGMAQFLAPPEGAVARQAGLLEENTTSLEPVAVAAGQYAMKPKFVFPIVIMDEKDGKGGIDAFLNKSCDDLKDKWGKGKAFRSCVALTLTATVNIDKFQTKKIIIGIKDGNLEEYTSQTSAEVNGELKFEAKVEALHGHSFNFSFLKALRKGLAKLNIKSTLPKDADEGTYKAGPLRFKGVPYEDDKLVLATVVYDLAKISTGLGAFGVQKGERVIGFSPKIYLTPFMKGSLEFKGQASLTYTSPRYRVLQEARFQEELRGGEKVLMHKEDLTPSERFTKIAEDSIALGMEGEAAAGISVGVDASVGMLNIVPLNITLFEAGVNAGISGKYDVEVGKPGTWCHSDGAITAGIRSFVDVALDLSIAKPGDDWHVAGSAYHLPIFPRSNPENWDSQFAPEWLSLGTDTCHQPKITRVDWLGGDFINNHYPFQFDASETGYKPLIDYLEWDFGDGVKLACLGSELDSKPDCLRPEHVYNQMGEYSAKLAVYYRDENDRKALTIGVGGVVDFELPDPNLFGDAGEFPHEVTTAIKIEQPYVSLMLKQGSGLTANIDLVSLEGKAQSYVVDWGDGTTDAGNWKDGVSVRLMHKYGSSWAGWDMPVKLTVKDRFGSTYSTTESVTPKAEQAIQRQEIKALVAGSETAFSLTGLKNDVDRVLLDFGDTVQELIFSMFDAIKHVFSAAGDYIVKATLYNDRGEELSTVLTQVSVQSMTLGEDSEKSFDDPTLENLYEVQKVGLDTSDGTLRLPLNVGEVDTTFPYIWIANSGEGTISKLATRDHYRKNPQTGEQELVKAGQELGRYLTGPGNGNPSRTTVDQEGNVWVGNRNNNTITKVGLQEFGNCVDRNGNGVIDTSASGADIKGWGGYFGDGQGIANAQDECVLLHVALSADGVSTPQDIRTIAIDKDNNVFAGGHLVASIFKVNGSTGEIIKGVNTSGSFYGGLVDKDGNVWAVSRNYNVGVQKINNDLSASEVIGTGINTYGIALDKYSKIWVTSVDSPSFATFSTANPNGTLQIFAQQGRGYQPCYAQGIAVDDNDNIFIAGCRDSTDFAVGHYKQVVDGANVSAQFVANYRVGGGPTGVAVDGRGNVWSANEYADSVSRVTLAANPTDAKVDTYTVGYRPYNYSDMTGRTVRNITNRQGTWEATFDGAIPDFEWKKLVWTLKQQLPAGTAVTAYAKVANSKVELGGLPYTEVRNNQPVAGMMGRFIKVRFILTSDKPELSPEITGIALQ